MPVETSLEGKVAVITGASQGIGRASALLLADAGANVVLSARGETGLQSVADEITQKGRTAVIVPGDVSSLDTAKAIFNTTRKEFGRADILVNSAGITGSDSNIMRLDPDSLMEILKTNLIGTMLITGRMLAMMAKQESGSIVNISSVVAAISTPVQPAYGASKGGVEAFTRYVAKTFASRGIRCNALAFGAIETPMLDAAEARSLAANQGSAKQIFMDMTPLGRLGTAQEAARSVLHLASDESSFTTGQILHVNGGMYLNT